MRPEWTDRLKHWMDVLEKEFYEPLGEIALEGFETMDMLSLKEAQEREFATMPFGKTWGPRWGYLWLRGEIVIPEQAAGKMIVMDLRQGGEATVFVNGEAFGTRRAEWVSTSHHYICDQVLARSAKPGDRYQLMLEAYAGHGYPGEDNDGCATGPVRPAEAKQQGDYAPEPDEMMRQKMGASTYGVWHEEAYQLWLDVRTILDLLESVEADSLRAARLEEALEGFTLAVDFEQERKGRLADYVRARELLRPVLEARNGTTAPKMAAIGNAHLDVCWLWPYRETQRKVARTFAQQVRLMDMYPDYKFIQSQPETYQICKELYPELYERIKEKIRAGQWIADGSMWVEPDTNMTSGESLIRQIMHGKKFYKDEFGVDCQLLWLPDTFGYSAVLPQILQGCGVKYLTTQKIFWTYNGSDPFPYHYFTWEGMDGSQVTSFLHMDYTSRTDAKTVNDRWKNRVQKRDIDAFLLPFGYGDGGGGPCRDHIEFALRQKNLEGAPKVDFVSPQDFFEDCAEKGAPKNKYVGELYFQCHRGTYTSQAAIKRGNRKSELALREAEMWGAAAADRIDYPAQKLDKAWKGVLLNQFHDILPGSSIARVYEEARKLYGEILKSAKGMADDARSALTDSSEGVTYFNSLSWSRRALVKQDGEYGYAVLPPCGWSSEVDFSLPEYPVLVCPLDDGGAILGNGILTVELNRLGEIVSCENMGRRCVGAKANVLRLYKDVPRKFDAWDIDSMYAMQEIDMGADAQLEVIEQTAHRCAIKVTRRFGKSVIEQEIALEAGSRRIDFITHVNWQETHRLLKATFPTGVHANEAINEIQFGYVKRPTHRSRPYDADRFEVCNHRYTALCDENRGAAVLNESKYGVSVLDDEIALTLLRAATCPDLNADKGEHDFTYSYYVWDGTFMESDVVREGYELNAPVTQAAGSAKAHSLMHVDAPNVVIDTVKLAEDGSGDMIVRLYESKHAQTRARLTFGFAAAQVHICDMLENSQEKLSIANGGVELEMRAFEVKTVRIRRK
ncbi:MAG: alpha-mannosidase [Clostridiales bacterium]|nr:alpha-mannosidase [Clostridiales bacterium]